MMKRTLCLLLVAIMLSSTLSVPAFATNSSGHETTVTYTVDTMYTVYIPEYINLSMTTEVDITANCLIESDKHLYVRINKDLTLVDGKFMLYKDGYKDASSVECTISVSSPVSNDIFTLEAANYTVAIFENAVSTPVEYGHMWFSPLLSPTQEFGVYHGTLYFTFSVE